MKSNSPEKIEQKYTIFTPSAGLSGLLNNLTPKQRRAVPLIVSYDLQGKPLEALFDRKNPDCICNRSLFQRVWKKNKVFMAALDMARSEGRTLATANVVMDTVDRLRQIAPLAANDLERQITGDAHALVVLSRLAQNSKRPVDERVAAVISMGMIGTRTSTDLLLLLIEDADPTIRKAAVEAIGKSATGLDTQRRMADIAVLDRAAPETADKANGPQVRFDVSQLSDEMLRRLADETETGDIAGSSPAGTGPAGIDPLRAVRGPEVLTGETSATDRALSGTGAPARD